MLDFYTWFKQHRSSDITVGITRVRQLTFQNVQKPDDAAAAGQPSTRAASGEAEKTDQDVMEVCLQNRCFPADFIFRMLSLPKSDLVAIDNILNKHGMCLPGKNGRSFTALFGATTKGKAKNFTEDPTAEVLYKMTYKTSM